MRETCALWMTPKSSVQLAELIPNREIAAAIAPAIQEYISTACRPLLSTTPNDIDRLPEHVTRLVIAGNEARMRFLGLLIAGLGKDCSKLLEFSAKLLHLIPEVREATAHLFERQYLDSYEMGVRVYFQTLQTLKNLVNTGTQDPVIGAHQRNEFYELLYVSSCLDLCATSILLYAEEDRSSEHCKVAQELCFLLKEYALAHGAIIRKLFAKPRDKRGQDAGLSLDDLRWDKNFSKLVMSSLGPHLASS